MTALFAIHSDDLAVIITLGLIGVIILGHWRLHERFGRWLGKKIVEFKIKTGAYGPVDDLDGGEDRRDKKA